MPAAPLIYGLDLITDSEGPAIDPSRHRIVAIGISTGAGDELFEGDEATILTDVDARLEMLSAGVITTWGGSVLALPLLSGRARAHGLELDLRVFDDERRAAQSVLPSPVLGVDRPMWGAWHAHPHLDLARVYDDNRRWRPLRSRRHESETENLMPVPDELTRRDPRKDARLARSLAERRWAQARKLIDRIPSDYRPRQVSSSPADGSVTG